jgi:hypothetical protein
MFGAGREVGEGVGWRMEEVAGAVGVGGGVRRVCGARRW